MRITVKRAVLRRQDDPQGEYRDLLIYQEDDLFLLWQGIGFFLVPPFEFQERKQLAFGREQDVKTKFAAEVHRLCHKEGFVVCEP